MPVSLTESRGILFPQNIWSKNDLVSACDMWDRGSLWNILIQNLLSGTALMSH